MRWTEEQTAKLKELCLEERSNEIIATEIGCKLTDVYGKRGQLGLTIGKCREIKLNQKCVTALPKPRERGVHKDVKQAFKDLDNAFLVAIARDETSIEEANAYATFAHLADSLSEALDRIIRGK